MPFLPFENIVENCPQKGQDKKRVQDACPGSQSHFHFDNLDSLENLLVTIDYVAIYIEPYSNSVVPFSKYLIQEHFSLLLEKFLRLLATGCWARLD